MKHILIMVLDSFGIGATEDAERFGDVRVDTLGHTAETCAKGEADNGRRGPLNLPNLTRLGLMRAYEDSIGLIPAGIDDNIKVIGAYVQAHEMSSGKNTPSGHWEIAGVPVPFERGYFSDHENNFPQELLDRLVERVNLPGCSGNRHSSGTIILDQLGEEHMKTGKPTFYTPANFVFQIACREEIFGLNKLYKLYEIAREELTNSGYSTDRVIACSSIGDKASNFQRIGNRHDLTVEPLAPAVLQRLASEKHGQVVSVGKTTDIYANCSTTKKARAIGLGAPLNAIIKEVREAGDNAIIFTNFVGFNSSRGHRRDAAGYAANPELFDHRLPGLMPLLRDDDILILAADHSCDPTWTGTGHMRERILVLVYSPRVKPGSLGYREALVDTGQTLVEYFGISDMEYGKAIFRWIWAEQRLRL